MRRRAFFVLTLMLVAPLAAAPNRKAAPKPIAPEAAAETKLIQNCDAHRFETVVDTVVDGQSLRSKVKLCGVEGQSDAEWVGTLRDAVRKVEADKEMASGKRNQIVTAIKAEIARLSLVRAPIPENREAREQGSSMLSRDYAALPPLPPAPETPAASTPAAPETPAALAPPTADATTNSAPPRADLVPSAAVAAGAALALPPVAVPRLKISCEAPTDFAGPAPCAGFERETRLTIEADGDVPSGTALEFIRNGRAQASLSLAGLGEGRAMRTSLPQSVCAGFGAGRLELRIVRGEGAEVVRSEGPYSLRC